MTSIRPRILRDAHDVDRAALRLDAIAAAAKAAGLQLDALPDDGVTILRTACCDAPYLAQLVRRDPHRLWRVAADPYLPREKPGPVMAAELMAATLDCPPDDPDELNRRLRQYRADEIVRLGVREFGLGIDLEVGRELAHLADVSFEFAIAFHDEQLRARFGPPTCSSGPAELVVIAMGKHGGEELNFTSDVDVIYIYTSDNGSAGDLSLHEYFSRLCRAVTRSLGEVTEDDFVFRVDLRLRPEGSRGAIANSLPSAERYYETFGRPWERQAWLKARPCAGSQQLGDEVMRTLEPFIYPRSTSTTVIEDVAALNQKIKSELDGAGLTGGFDLKNGVGGIREIEFFVQALQLVHGGRRTTVRSRTTMVALDQLLFAGIITDDEHRALADAYRWLRHLEHTLQLDSGRQTQRLPIDDDDLDDLAGRARCADRAELLSTLAHHTVEVARLFATLGEDDEPARPAVRVLLAADLDPTVATAALRSLGFRDPVHALRTLELARSRPMSPFGPTASGAAARVAPELLSEIATSPDPEQALGYAVDLIRKRSSSAGIWRLFDDNPPVLRLIASVFGTSEYLAKTFVNHPELIDSLLLPGRPQRTRAELERALDERFATIDPDDEETQWNQLADFKLANTLRIGLADIGGELDAMNVSLELSRLADVCLTRAFSIVSHMLRERHGDARDASGAPATMAVLGLGKLGGEELGYASDLDVVFVYSADGETDGRRPLATVTYMTRLAQRLMGGLHVMHPAGRLYELDTRLRPSGSKGLLVSSLSGWRRYHETQARLWERQALIKLRPVAGDLTLGAQVAEEAARFVYGREPGKDGRPGRADIAFEVTQMRNRIERELAGPRTGVAPASGLDLKTGKGGLVDIEFAAQYIQLTHGWRHPALRTRATLAALVAAAVTESADEHDCALLSEGYRFLRALEHRMRIVHDRSVHRLPDKPDELEKLARRARYPSGEALTRTYQRWTRDVRRAYTRILGL